MNKDTIISVKVRKDLGYILNSSTEEAEANRAHAWDQPNLDYKWNRASKREFKWSQAIYSVLWCEQGDAQNKTWLKFYHQFIFSKHALLPNLSFILSHGPSFSHFVSFVGI